MPIIGNFPSGGGSGSGGLTLTAVTNIRTLAAHCKVYVKWTDPDDVIVAGSNLAEWGGTLLVRKAGSAPVSRRDGTIVLDSRTRNEYQSKYFCDSGLADGVTYYYKFFPYTTQSVYTDSPDNEFNKTPNPVLLGNVSNIVTAVAGDGKMSVKWTDPLATVVEDGVTLATRASTVLVVKEGSYATSPTDPNAAFTYTSTTRNGHTADPVIATNLTNGKTYYVTLFPMSTDGAANTNTANRTTGVANKFTVSATPSQSGSLTYNANTQTPAWLNYNSTQLTLGGVTSGINAGSYDATFTPKADYMWSDGSSTARTVSWKIGKATISAAPTTSSSFTYDGYSKSPVWSGYDSAQMTIGGTYSATNAGNYTATFTPTANYQWSDGTVTARNVSWSIAKAAGSLTLSAYAVTLDSSTLSTTVTVTRSGDGDITATSNDTTVATVTVSNNTLTIRHVNQTTGTAVITVNVAAGTNHTAPASRTVAVTAQFATIYGVEWDWTSSGPTRGTRTDAAAGFSDPSPAVNNGNGSSPFDTLMPWAGMVKETRTGGVMVKEPKYWFKWTKTGKKLKLQIADGPVDGFSVDPVNRDRGDGLGELDFSYIGRYHCASDTWKSETNKAQKVNVTRSSARTGIQSLGANIYQFDLAQFWYIGMLFLVEFADWNGERIGRGCSANGSRENNGKTDAMGYHTGTTAENQDTYGFTQYRWIEGYWDNVYDWIDGCYYTSSGLNVIKNPRQHSDNANGVMVGKPAGSGYPSGFAIPTLSDLDWVLYPNAVSGSESTYVPDYWDFRGTDPCLLHGGAHPQTQSRGPFCVYCDGASNTYDIYGCRLQERPPKTA